MNTNTKPGPTLVKSQPEKPEVDRTPSVWNPKFKYAKEIDTKAPNYLRNKFKRIEREQKAKQEAKPMRRVK